MNKKEFLKQLEENLMILEENERKDIINDYKEIIEEKIKAGEDEASAIKSLGELDDLTKEILSSYKINSDYNKKKVDTKKIIKDSENWIKKTSKKLANFTTDTFNNIKGSKNLTIELIFEILIKVLILLILCAILKLPFMLIESLGVGIFHVFSPFDRVLIIIWKLLVAICYLVGCILLFFVFFKDYFKNNDIEVEEKEEKKATKKKEKNNIEEAKEDKVINNKKDSSIIKAFKWIVRFFIVVCILVPTILANIGLICADVISLWFVCHGINIWGLTILLLGLVVLGLEFYDIVYSLTFKKLRICIWSFIVGAILIVVGSIAFTDNIMSFNYYNISAFGDKNSVVFEEYIDGYTEIAADRFIVDNTLEDNLIKISVSYYEEYNNVSAKELENEIRIVVTPKESNFNNLKKIYNKVIKDLKNGKVYNYYNLDDYNVVVYANSKTIKQLDD